MSAERHQRRQLHNHHVLRQAAEQHVLDAADGPGRHLTGPGEPVPLVAFPGVCDAAEGSDVIRDLVLAEATKPRNPPKPLVSLPAIDWLANDATRQLA